MNRKGIIASVLLMAALCIGSYCIGRKGYNRPVAESKSDTVTITLHDTIVAEMPVYLTSRTVDTMLVAVTDTLMQRDTCWVTVEREQRHYHQDSLYDAWVSGYRPQLDCLRIYAPRVVTRIETSIPEFHEYRTRWGVGVQAGYGAAAVDGSIRLAPYVGVGVSYNIWSW
ncbi:MAG: hypothetical protein MJY60_04260 [Bacteroidales bacterium]|nr:hypothetical protein [Bacteroidales bacterium]